MRHVKYLENAELVETRVLDIDYFSAYFILG